MKVFLSWSGNRSQKIANLLSDWLSCVIQSSRPWISTRDIDRGSLWFSEIHDQLKDTSVGVICLTQENKDRPWILFEAGALAKGLSTARVCTLLIDLEPKDIEDPLAQFNHTFPTKESMNALVKTLNSALASNGLDPRILEQVFETYWPAFEEQFSQIMEETKPSHPAKPRPKEDLLSEILTNTRMLTSRIHSLERDIQRLEFVREPSFPTLTTGTPRMKEIQNEINNLVRQNVPNQIIISQFKGIIPTSRIQKFIDDAIGSINNNELSEL